MIGLAKREEQIVIEFDRSHVSLNKQKLELLGGRVTNSEHFILVNLPHDSHIVKLLQRIRDESHRFAVSYHTVLKRQRQTASKLEEIPTIGPQSRRALLKKFGSVRAISEATEEEIAQVVGAKRAVQIKRFI